MDSSIIRSIAAILILAAVHPLCAVVSRRHVRQRVISFCAGVALAYVFLHLLPELGQMQQELLEHLGEERPNPWFREHLYVLSFIGLLGFQLVDTLSRKRDSTGTPLFSDRVEMAFFALYAALIGYLIMENAELDRPILLITIALAAHLFGTDLDLAERYDRPFVKRESYVFAAATIVGMIVAMVSQVNDAGIMIGYAVLAGALLINTLRTELPEPAKVRNLYVLFGAAGYSALMLFIYSVSRAV